MTNKRSRNAALIERFRGHELDAHYLGYVECFNRQLFYEAHDVLEELWLTQRAGPNGAFYKGLIQLAGAFVHLQKNRLRPAAALFKMAETNLRQYPASHERLNVREVLQMIQGWTQRLGTGGFDANPLLSGTAPELVLLS